MNTITFDEWSNIMFHGFYLPLTDNDEAGIKCAAYSTLALLWGKKPLTENVDYRNGAMPYEVEPCTQENYDKYEKMQHEFFDRVSDLISPDDIEEFLNDALKCVNTSTLAWYVICRWNDAEEVYGLHPSGLTIATEQIDSRSSFQFHIQKSGV